MGEGGVPLAPSIASLPRPHTPSKDCPVESGTEYSYFMRERVWSTNDIKNWE